MGWYVKILLINFLDTFGNGLPRRKQHRTEDALFRLDAMRRGTVNILRRTCVRNGDNLFAAFRRRSSASGRLSRHLFGFFFLFFFPAEKSLFLFRVRPFGRGALRFPSAVAGFL